MAAVHLKKSVDRTINPEKFDKNNVLAKLLSNPYWRINNLYYVVNEQGEKVKFVLNKVQEKLYRDMWYWNIIPKSRQHGITTFACIVGLDMALFNNNKTVNIIAHKLDDAEKIFAKKVKFPYDNLAPEIQDRIKAEINNVRELHFNNGSTITVDTSSRSDSINFLHISEFAKICAKYPDRANEIITGSIPAVHTGNILFIESTSEGNSGKFFEYCKEARDRTLSGKLDNKRQMKLHFFAWWESLNNVLDAEDVEIYPYLEDYFRDLEFNHQILLSPEQKAWYANESKMFGEAMKYEHPSFYEECFMSAHEGAYYAKQFVKMREDGRICPVPFLSDYKVNTTWDLGISKDDTAIWFWQMVGREVHVIDYYETTNEGMKHYIDILTDKSREYGYRYDRHIAPFDLWTSQMGDKNVDTRYNIARRLGLHFERAEDLDILDGIECVRQLLDSVWMDEVKCKEGYTKLEKYRREWDSRRGVWKDKPYHDENSHAADSMRYLAVSWKKPILTVKERRKSKKMPVGAWT